MNLKEENLNEAKIKMVCLYEKKKERTSEMCITK